MAECFIGEIRAFGFNYAPQGWVPCDGRLLPIQQYSALFALLGTQYGGNGQTNFGIPDLRGRVAIGQGSGPGLTPRNAGQMGGAETCALTVQQMPNHNHLAACTSNDACDGYPTNKVPATTAAASYAAPGANEYFANNMITNTGSNQAHPNLQPFTVINYCIAVEGIFPPRN